ncbi:MAG: DUF4212 domain-containing protein [Magnetococcales bacterium]|nr:DUF4212 domain-containing protein [Magnetococcales bacterium]NGZ26047.1 DUF4212 domain-containing protein [Magnetococcales bacterium]
MVITDRHRAYWRQTKLLTAILTLIWAVVSFVIPFFASELNEYSFLAFPVGFFMASLGSLILFVLLTGYYAWAMDRLDRKYGVDEDDSEDMP